MNLKQGVVGAFTLTRALSSIHVPDTCTPLPLECGTPFHYFSTSMLAEGLSVGFESLLGYGAAAIVLNSCLKFALVRPLSEDN